MFDPFYTTHCGLPKPCNSGCRKYAVIILAIFMKGTWSTFTIHHCGRDCTLGAATQPSTEDRTKRHSWTQLDLDIVQSFKFASISSKNHKQSKMIKDVCMLYLGIQSILPKGDLAYPFMVAVTSDEMLVTSSHHDAGHQQWPESWVDNHICKEQMMLSLSMHHF